MIYTTKIDSNNFDEFVNSENVSLVYISASWCGPCKVLSPIIDEIMNEKNGAVILDKIHADEQMEIESNHSLFGEDNLQDGFEAEIFLQ
jgi:thioredoxin-like negative regulator of GroEL